MKQIVAIGGGGFASRNKTLNIEKYLINLTNKPEPKVCFLPQASAENTDYITLFYDNFIALGAKPSWVSLFGRVENNWKEKLLEQDIIYVGGGNTKSMLCLWKEWGLTEVIKEAYNKGIILTGVSAGAICWFEECVTDSVWPLGIIPGLNFIKGSCCPHYDSELERRPTYIQKVNSNEITPGIALQDNTAGHYINGVLHKVISSVDNQKAYNVFVNKEEELRVEFLKDFN